MKFKLCVLIFSFLLCNCFAYSQTKLLLKVNKCIKAGVLSEATEVLEKYKSKEGLTNAAILLGIKIDLRKSNNIETIESCETNLINLLKSVGLSSNSEDVKIEMTIGLYPDSLKSLITTVHSQISLYYQNSNNVSLLEQFISKYPNSKSREKIVFLRDSLNFSKIMMDPKIEAIEQFLSNYPDNSFNDTASIVLENLWFEKTQLQNSSISYRLFLERFPESKYKETIIRNWEDLEWDKTTLLDDKSAYEKFLRNFPNSLRKNEVDNALINIEKREWQMALESGSTEVLNKFKQKYPKSIFIESVDAKIKELQFLILPFLGADRMYRLYDVSTSQFFSSNSYNSAQYLSTGHILLKSDSLEGVVDLKGNIIIPFEFVCISNTEFDDYIVFSKGKYGLYSTSGVKIISPTYDFITTWNVKGYYEVSIGHGAKRKCGIIDSTGKVVIPINYNDLSSVTDTFPGLFIAKINGLDQLMHVNGDKIGKSYKYIYPLDSTYLIAGNETLKTLINLEGSEIFPMAWENIAQGNVGEYILTKPNGEIGIMNIKKQLLFPFQKAYSVTPLANHLYVVDISTSDYGGSQMVFNTASSSFISGKDTYRNISLQRDKLYSAELGKNIRIFDDNWNLIKEFADVISQETISEYESYGDEYPEDYEQGEGGMGGEEDGYYYGCNYWASNMKSKLSIDESTHSPSDLFPFWCDGKYGFVDRDFNLVIPLNYSSCGKFINGIANVTRYASNETTNSIYSIINENGKVILNNYQIIGWDKSKPNEYLVANYSGNNIGANNAWYNSATLTLTPFIDKEIYNYNLFPKFAYYTYRDVNVFETLNGERLMDPKIQFNNYYSSQLKTKAWDFRIKEDYDEAISTYIEALKLYSEDVAIYSEIAACYILKEDYNQALNYLNKGLSYSLNSNLLTSRIRVYEKLYQYSNAALDYLSLAEIAKKEKYENYNIANYYFGAASEYLKENKYQTSIEATNLGMKYDLSASWAYCTRGVAYWHLGKLELSLQDFRTAVNKCKYCNDSDFGIYAHNAANVLIQLKRNSEACVYFKKAADKDSKYNYDYNRYCH